MKKNIFLMMMGFILFGGIALAQEVMYEVDLDELGVQIKCKVDETEEVVDCPIMPEDKTNCRVWDSVSNAWNDIYGKRRIIKVKCDPIDETLAGEAKYYTKVEREVGYEETEVIRKTNIYEGGWEFVEKAKPKTKSKPKTKPKPKTKKSKKR